MCCFSPARAGDGCCNYTLTFPLPLLRRDGTVTIWFAVGQYSRCVEDTIILRLAHITKQPAADVGLCPSLGPQCCSRSSSPSLQAPTLKTNNTICPSQAYSQVLRLDYIYARANAKIEVYSHMVQPLLKAISNAPLHKLSYRTLTEDLPCNTIALHLT